jgi:MFS family permease
MDMPAGEPASEAELQTPWAPLAGVIATVSVFAVAQGLSYPLLAFILERQGASAGMIGLSSAMTPLGLIAGSPLIPPLVRRTGADRLALACAILAALCFILIGWTQHLIAWFPLRFLVGVAIGPLFVLSEVWIIGLAPPQRRGRILGIYTAVISAGFAAGPLSLLLVGTKGWPPFAVGVAAFVGCALCLAALGPRLPRLGDEKAHASVRSFLPHAPVLLFAVFATAAFEQSVFSLLPVYGLSYGLGEAQMSALLAVLVAGNIALQAPLGLAAERWSVRPVIVACALATALGCALLPFLVDTPLVWPLVFLWGSLSFGVYTLVLVELGERFSGSMLIAGNAAFALFWGVGGIAGPPVTGGLMDWVGLQGLPTALGLMYLALAAVRLVRR